jgi:hypothetical protein
VDPRIGRAAVGAAALIAVVAGVNLVRAQPQDQPPPASAQDAGPPPPLPPTVMSPSDQKPGEPGPSTGSGVPPGPVSMGPIVQAPPPIRPPEQKPTAALEPPRGPPKPVRSQIAVLQVLDKVTAETLKFIAPVGRPVRYKTLVFTVRACETRNLDAPQPQPSAYLLIESRAGVTQGDGSGSKAVYKGWMFANAPDVHPFEHPVYDAWLVACSASPPPA